MCNRHPIFAKLVALSSKNWPNPISGYVPALLPPNISKKSKVPILVTERNWAQSWSRCTGSQPAGDYKLSPGSRLPLLSARPAFYLRKRSPDGATPNWGNRYSIAAYYSSIDPEGMKGWVGLVDWPIADGLPTKWSPVSYRSSALHGKFAGQRPTFFRWATQPTVYDLRKIYILLIKGAR